MLAVTLPDWVTPENARTIALVVGIAAIVLIVFVLRFVQKLMMKIIVTVLLALIGLGAWYERADLEDCARTCSCRIFGQDINISDSNPNC